jgi:hypothetical protein
VSASHWAILTSGGRPPMSPPSVVQSIDMHAERQWGEISDNNKVWLLMRVMDQSLPCVPSFWQCRTRCAPLPMLTPPPPPCSACTDAPQLEPCCSTHDDAMGDGPAICFGYRSHVMVRPDTRATKLSSIYVPAAGRTRPTRRRTPQLRKGRGRGCRCPHHHGARSSSRQQQQRPRTGAGCRYRGPKRRWARPPCPRPSAAVMRG